jgi:hypothetical protein
MSRKFLLLIGVLLALTLVSVSYGGSVVIGNFEDGVDGAGPTWENSTTQSQTTTGATSGTSALEVNPVDTYTGGWSWAFQVDNSAIFAAAQGLNPRLVADVTVIPSEWVSAGGDWDIWLGVDKVAIQGDGLGWTEFPITADSANPGSMGWTVLYGQPSDIYQTTITWDLSARDWTTLPASPSWAQIIFTTNFGTSTSFSSIGNVYFDNIRIETDDPTSEWHRYEAEDAVLTDTYFINDDEDCSGGQYVQLEKRPPDWDLNGQITFNINVRTPGAYPMRIGQSSGGDLERYASLTVNGASRDIFSGFISWGAEAAIGGNNGWDNQAVIEDLFASVTLYGADGGWQLWDRWAAEWDNAALNTPMIVDLVEGQNTINIFGTWAWDRWDFVELKLGYLPANPIPEDKGIGLIRPDSTLSWNNAVANLDQAQVWFGKTPVFVEGDPNTLITSQNYKDILDLIATIPSPGAKSSVPAPAMDEGRNYTWVVDGKIEGNVDANDLFYGGPFWTFMATENTPPIVNAGPDRFVWLTDGSVTVQLDGLVDDDGKFDDPPAYKWTQLAGPAVTIAPDDTLSTSVTLTELGNNNEQGTADPYEFQLEVYDGLWTRADIVTVYVSSDSCFASHEMPGAAYDVGDFDQDCDVDLVDFAQMASNWMACSNTLETCY